MSLILAIILIVIALVSGLSLGKILTSKKHLPQLQALLNAAQESQHAKADALREIAEVQKSREVIKRDFEKAHEALQEAKDEAESLERAITVERKAGSERNEEITLIRQKLASCETGSKELADKLAATLDELRSSKAKLEDAEKGIKSANSLKKQLEIAKKMNEQGQKQRQELQSRLDAQEQGS